MWTGLSVRDVIWVSPALIELGDHSGFHLLTHGRVAALPGKLLAMLILFRDSLTHVETRVGTPPGVTLRRT